MGNPTEIVSRRGFSLGAKLGAIFCFLALLMVVVAAGAARQLATVRLDARRTLEESREMRLVYGMVVELERLEALLSGEDGEEPRRLARNALAGALQALAELESVEEEDPSARTHQDSETEMFTLLQSRLHDVETRIARDRWAPARDSLSGCLETARRLGAEMRIETIEATRDLERRVGAMVRAIVVSAVLAIVILTLGFLMIDYNVVRPMRTLREGTRAFGEGDLDHRVQARSRDEIGELANEFNRMADRLQASHRDLEQQVEERTSQLLHAARLASLGTFAAGLAHEVNTPLATIASAAEGMQRRLAAGDLDTETALDYSETIRRESFRSSGIVTRMLSIARKDPGPVHPCSLAPRLGELANVVGARFAERDVRLRLDLGEQLPDVVVNGDEIEQAVINLLNNALDASPPQATVWLRCLRHPDGVAVEVADRGPGVPTADRNRVFDPFFTTKDQGAGTGLGLSLTYRIVERNGGQIEVEHPDAGGALFRIVLPTGRTGVTA